MSQSDPFYETGAAAWLLAQAEEYGVPVELDAELAFPGFARTDRPAIIARPGLEVPTLNWLVACGIVGNRFGFDVTPDLPTSDGGRGPRRGHLRLIPGGAR